MQIITFRFVFERCVLEDFNREKAFSDRIPMKVALREANRYFLAVIVCSTEPTNRGSWLITILSSTILDINKYMVKRLWLNGVPTANMCGSKVFLWDILRAHYAAAEKNLMLDGSGRVRWTDRHQSGAGATEHEPFEIHDPEIAEFARLFRWPAVATVRQEVISRTT